MYKDGQIITKSEHIEFANWNNANGNKFRSESLGDGTYKIVEIVIPEPTEYEKAQARIAELKQMLADSDWVVIKLAESDMPEEQEELRKQYVNVISERKAWRAEINELELTVDNSQIIV